MGDVIEFEGGTYSPPNGIACEVIIPRWIGSERFNQTIVNLREELGPKADEYFFEPVGSDRNAHLYTSELKLLGFRKNA